MWSAWSLRCSFPSPYTSLLMFWYKLMLVSSVQRIWLQNNWSSCQMFSHLVYSVLECCQMFPACCKASVLTSMTALSRVFLISVDAVKGFFFTKERTLIIHFSCLWRSSRALDAGEITRGFFLFFFLIWLISCLSHRFMSSSSAHWRLFIFIEISLDLFAAPVKQLPTQYLIATPDILSASFDLTFCQTIIQILSIPWKWRYFC